MNVRELSARVQPLRKIGPQQQARSLKKLEGDESPNFAKELAQAKAGEASPTSDIKLSAHASQRIEERSIPFSELDRQHISDAMQQLENKGARNALLLRDDAAFVVNVPNRTMVTAIGEQELQNRIFTQIDSTMLL